MTCFNRRDNKAIFAGVFDKADPDDPDRYFRWAVEDGGPDGLDKIRFNHAHPSGDCNTTYNADNEIDTGEITVHDRSGNPVHRGGGA